MRQIYEDADMFKAQCIRERFSGSEGRYALNWPCVWSPLLPIYRQLIRTNLARCEVLSNLRFV
jgi:hypothetical protein